MSLDSTFWMDIAAAPDAVLALLVERCGYERPAKFTKHPQLYADGVILSLFAPPLSREMPKAAGIGATQQFLFACTDSDLSKAWTLKTFRAVSALLNAYPGDALLRYSSDLPALLRKDGRIVLDARCGLWNRDVEPQVLPLIPQPHVFALIPIPE